MKNIFVLALDEENRRTLRDIRNADSYAFHSLLTVDETQVGEIDFEQLLDKAQSQLDAFDGSIDAIVGYWDFPVSTLRAILCHRYGLPGPSLASIVKCEHKYWSRLEQQKAIDEYPRFGIVDLDDEQPSPPDGVRYPMWLKPVKSYSSELAFLVRDESEFDKAVAEIREGISRVGKPFEQVLDMLELPREIAEVGGQACLAEEALSGVQCATEGYVYNGEVVVYGVLDSVNYEGRSSFLRHQYPSQLPKAAVDRMIDVSKRIIGQIGMDNSTFSIEFFCEPESGDVCLLEINPRHSQSHAEMFECVDGMPNHHAMVMLGLGRDPALPDDKGEYGIAAKWYYRRFSDALVRKVPTAEEIERVHREIPGVIIDIVPVAGQRLSDLPGQDSYSFELAHVFVGARDETELKDKYERTVEALDFEFAEEGPEKEG
ncbi:biotin carboxylase [Prauserella sp. PE36]|uniref:ATP-grasp domain-containing protein n=1 Tax=Prauserella endophytica TaxID=1592324 RepID=A0ABY2S7J7_9PSEU|nr:MULTISPECIES: ATP-grasp domain-containing protein [Prauserella]PXY25989.1 biotin carboxylase [Prauserella coralliicola]RBM24111.1 biotin carboxylase [Prauserella sp. PE36]TKG71873.1 ATP-grasp domain-containing protein [Prauserella endophytica]